MPPEESAQNEAQSTYQEIFWKEYPMRIYHIACERGSTGLFLGWSVHTAENILASSIYPRYDMAESESQRLEEAYGTPAIGFTLLNGNQILKKYCH
ncbi:hypothetical protein KIF53_21640 [Chromobacterium subtsugae]|uniref:Uncharacterized protein n=2 Tax=Chromobacterium subtsugae TaxID=251747 RepID=A0ABS7FJX3_9NEIS|nr:hypothetical protein [Chromobacterium sp. F49]MBW8290246.1 hypothetical protein [Chromobacterium subtsugae]